MNIEFPIMINDIEYLIQSQSIHGEIESYSVLRYDYNIEDYVEVFNEYFDDETWKEIEDAAYKELNYDIE